MSESNNKKILEYAIFVYFKKINIFNKLFNCSDVNQNNEKSNEYNQIPTYYLSRTVYSQEDVQQISGYDERDKECNVFLQFYYL